MNFYWKVGLAMGAVIAVAIGVILFLPRGEEREIRAVIDQGMDAARKGDADGVIALISSNYGGNPEEYAEVCNTIRQYVGPGKYKDLQVLDVEIRMFGESASARFKVRVIEPKGLPNFDRWIEIDLHKEPEGWRVTSAKSDPGNKP